MDITVTQNKPSATYSFKTAGTYVDGDINLTVAMEGDIMTLDGLLTTSTVQVFDNVSISANTYSAQYGSALSKDGYTAIGILGVDLMNATSSGTNVTLCAINRFYINVSKQPYIVIRNTGSSACKIRCEIKVLWAKLS